MKKLLSIIMAIAIIIVTLPVGALTVSAAIEHTSGYYTYTVENGEATITKVNPSISGDITIPSTLDGYTITRIGYGAFDSCTQLTAVTFGDSVSSIDEYAFYCCTNLTSLTIGKGVKVIGFGAFEYCENLSSITIPDNVTSIGGYAFYKTAYYSNENNWENDVLYIGNHLIEAKDNISNYYNIKSSTKTIAQWAFFGCTYLAGVTIPDSVISISKEAFISCRNLTTITIPKNVSSIEQRVFYGCARLETINVSEENMMYSSNNGVLFNKDKTHIVCYPCGKTSTSYTIPNTVVYIDESAFYACDNLTSVIIPDSVIRIGDSAFYSCSSIISATIGNSVESIGSYAFTYCNSLTNLTIPNSVLNIGEYAYSSCSSIKSVNISDSVLNIGEFAFRGCHGLTSITIPKNVTSIGQGAFADCSSLKTITVSENNTVYSSSNGILFNKDKTHIVCYPCGKTSTSYTIPNTVVYIEDGAFYACNNLTSVIIPDSVTTIGANAFAECNGLTSIKIPNGVKKIGNSAFQWCTNLIYVTIPKSVTSIGEDIFWSTSANIYGYKGSYAETYANEHGISFVALQEYYGSWKISSTKTGIYNIQSNTVAKRSISSEDIAVFDGQGNLVQYNEIKQGWPLVANQEYTVSFKYEYDETANINWNLTKTADTIFPDTNAGDWYNDAVTYSVGRGILRGYSNGNFGTADGIQRQDFLVMLARLDGVDLETYATRHGQFPDVQKNSYYEAAVMWGYENGIVTGYQNGKFGVGDKITREQIVTFLYRYAKYKGLNVSYTSTEKNKVKNNYTDYKKVTSFAEEPIIWAISNGVINGKTSTTIVPQGNAQRCEVAQIMYNIFQNDVF